MSTFREKLDKTHAKAESLKDVTHVTHKHTQADVPQGVAGAHNWNDSSLRPAEVHKGATAGASWAAEHSISGSGMDFTPSSGMHSVGADHIGAFNSALRGLGQVKQGPSYVSDPASGVARASIDDCGCKGPCTCDLHNLNAQGQGSGRSFRDRQSARVGRSI